MACIAQNQKKLVLLPAIGLLQIHSTAHCGLTVKIAAGEQFHASCAFPCFNWSATMGQIISGGWQCGRKWNLISAGHLAVGVLQRKKH